MRRRRRTGYCTIRALRSPRPDRPRSERTYRDGSVPRSRARSRFGTTRHIRERPERHGRDFDQRSPRWTGLIRRSGPLRALAAISPALDPATEIVVCIPCFRRPQYLRRTLESLAAQRTGRRFAVVMVENDASKSESVPVAAEYLCVGEIRGAVRGRAAAGQLPCDQRRLRDRAADVSERQPAS